jgi:hypothetical protein
VTTPTPPPSPAPRSGAEPTASTRTLRLSGSLLPEVWNRFGTKILPKLRSGSELNIGLEFSVAVPTDSANGLASDLRQLLQELGLGEAVRVALLLRASAPAEVDRPRKVERSSGDNAVPPPSPEDAKADPIGVQCHFLAELNKHIVVAKASTLSVAI